MVEPPLELTVAMQVSVMQVAIAPRQLSIARLTDYHAASEARTEQTR